MKRAPDTREMLTIEQWQEALLMWLEHKGRIEKGVTWHECATRLNLDNSMLVELWRES